MLGVDLFAGAGGMSLGFEAAGFNVVAAVEYDPVHAAVHAFNHPATKVLCRDVRTLTATDVIPTSARSAGSRNRAERVAVVFGGPTCQGFSSIGHRNVADERNDNLLQFVRLALEIKPRLICFENVPGLLSPKYEPLLDAAVSALERGGYTVAAPWVLDAADFGVPQHRKRVFVVAYESGPAPQPPQAEGGGVITVAEALEGLPSPFCHPELLERDWVKLSTEELARLRVTRRTSFAHQMRSQKGVWSGATPRVWQPALLTNSLLTQHAPATLRRISSTSPGSVEPVSRAYRLRADRPARTLRAGTGSERGAFSAPRPLHPVEDRVITAREAARLHSFPDWIRLHGTNWHAHRQIGNAVPPLLARAVALSLRSALGHLDGAPVDDSKPVRTDSSLLYLSSDAAAARMDARIEDLPAKRRRAVGD